MAAGSVALFGAPTVAQVDPGTDDDIPVTLPLSVDTATGDPYTSDHRRPSVSADGTIVVFEAVTDPEVGVDPDAEPDVAAEPDVGGDPADIRIVVTDRLAGTTAGLPGQRVDTDPSGTVTAAPAVSGDGCRVAFSALLPAPADEPGTPATVELRVADRCGQVDAEVEAEPEVDADPDAAEPDATVVDAVPAPGRFAVPALSADGATIAWSTGQEVRRYELDPAAGTWGLTDRIDATPPSATTSPDPATDQPDPVTDQPDTVPTGADPTSDDRVTHDTIALSADGDTLAFAAGPGGVPFAPEPANVFVWSISSGTPTIDLASMTAAGTPGAADSLAPSLSADGQLLVFESSSTDLAAVGEANAVAAPFVVMLERGQGTGVLASDARQPVISADGRHVAHIRAAALVRTTWVSGTPFAVTTDTEVAPVAPLSRPGVSQHGRWVVYDSDAGPALTDDERFAVGGHVWIADLRPDGSVPDVTTTSTDPPVTDPTTSGPTASDPTTSGPTTGGPTTSGPTTSDPTTTDAAGGGVDAPVASTSPPQSTVPIGTLPPEFSFPPLRLPSSPPPTSPPRTGTSSSGTSSTGTASAPEPPPTFDATDVRFADTIAAAGRSTATVTLSNPGSDRVIVSALRIEPSLDSPFAIVDETCTATPLSASGTCSIELEFRPLVAGTVTATLIADTDTSSGAVAVVLTGDGIGPPVLDVVPAVAMPGQVVTVFGSGFPAGATVDFSWGLGTSVSHADAQTDLIDVDADGSFAHVVVVLPNTMPGPVPVLVPGQVDLFGDVEAELLVSGSRGSFSAAIRAGSTFAR